eukprot:995062-Amphidinium_carterae.1
MSNYMQSTMFDMSFAKTKRATATLLVQQHPQLIAQQQQQQQQQRQRQQERQRQRQRQLQRQQLQQPQ